MIPKESKQLLQGSPFRPIKICTGSNKIYSISHPGFAALSPDGEMLIVFLPGRGSHDVMDVPRIGNVQGTASCWLLVRNVEVYKACVRPGAWRKFGP